MSLQLHEITQYEHAVTSFCVLDTAGLHFSDLTSFVPCGRHDAAAVGVSDGVCWV